MFLLNFTIRIIKLLEVLITQQLCGCFQELQTFRLGDGCELHGLTPEAFQNLVYDFIDCGTRYCRLRAFCASSALYNGGLIFQAFLVALNRVLHHYTAVVLSISGSLNILHLKFLCHNLFSQMK